MGASTADDQLSGHGHRQTVRASLDGPLGHHPGVVGPQTKNATVAEVACVQRVRQVTGRDVGESGRKWLRVDLRRSAKARHPQIGQQRPQTARSGGRLDVNDGHVTQELEAADGVVDFDAVSLLPANDKQLVVEYSHAVDGGVATGQDADWTGAIYSIIVNQLMTAIHNLKFTL